MIQIETPERVQQRKMLTLIVNLLKQPQIWKAMPLSVSDHRRRIKASHSGVCELNFWRESWFAEYLQMYFLKSSIILPIPGFALKYIKKNFGRQVNLFRFVQRTILVKVYFVTLKLGYLEKFFPSPQPYPLPQGEGARRSLSVGEGWGEGIK